jgi:hypothetical protein
MATFAENTARAEQFAKDIRNFASEIRDAHDSQFRELQYKYWEMHARLSEEKFSSRWDQTVAIKELSELGLALHGMAQAYRAVNKAACITD